MSNINLQQRFTGCLLGCAVGDALGAPYEGLWSDCIPVEKELMRGFSEFEGYPLGQYTDDTQLTLATVKSIVQEGEISYYDIAQSIAVLWKTQEVIGPGGACTRAADKFLQTKDCRNCGAPVGNAGNGTAMRTAALGLMFVENPANLPEITANVSRITHQDPRSIAGGIAIAKAAQIAASGSDFTAQEFCDSIAESMSSYETSFAELVQVIPRFVEETSNSKILDYLAWSGMPAPEFSTPIITPFVIPTVLASLWSFLKFRDSWEEAVSCAISLGGDVDTLGAIVGALSGAFLGDSAILKHLRENVYQSKTISSLAKRYYQTFCAT